MFVDKVKIYAKAGSGGRGCASFRRERFIPKGGPDGGDGGKGGDLILKATASEETLVFFKFRQHCVAANGLPGQGKSKNGKRGEDKIFKVPLGTLVKDFETGKILADLVFEDQEYIACRGGQGGRGNTHFKNSVNKTPRNFEMGEKGEDKILQLELKIIADFALVGYPNAGKTSLFNVLSGADREVASYPFTTLNPLVAKIPRDEFSFFSLADIPGLIDGAHKNIGLGSEFLRHIERTKILILVLDMSETDGRDVSDDFRQLQKELSLYQDDLLTKISFIVANKMDGAKAKSNLKKLGSMTKLPIVETIVELSENIEEVLFLMRESLKKWEKEEILLQKKNKKQEKYIDLEEDDFI